MLVVLLGCMAVIYKQKCFRCKTNYVVVTWKEKFPNCYDCQKKELEGEIKDKKMKAFFTIPEDFYKENSFLRNIKVAYLRYGKLTEKQSEAFKKTVDRMKGEKKAKPKEEKDKVQ